MVGVGVESGLDSEKERVLAVVNDRKWFKKKCWLVSESNVVVKSGSTGVV